MKPRRFKTIIKKRTMVDQIAIATTALIMALVVGGIFFLITDSFKIAALGTLVLLIFFDQQFKTESDIKNMVLEEIIEEEPKKKDS